MASYTDAITQFNPYVSTLPVDAMVKVGMQKQAQYEQGVQKIQQSIDNIAGMDVLKDVDKNYLQSKLNELGNNLKYVAAGDFSNFQLVNSVSGMAKQIGRDETVQNAVASTVWYKKQRERQQSLQKEGKSGQSNDWLFNQEADKWLTDKTPGATFNTTYRPYTNWKKNSLEVIKSLTKDETITDDAFTTDANGKLVIADAIVRKKMAGISPEKIQQALLIGLSPDDFKQMEIDGRYNYSNNDDMTFASKVNQSYTDKVDFYNKQITILENAKSSTNSVVERKKLDEQISSLEKTVKSVTSEYNSVTETFKTGDVESAKARLFTIDALNNFSKTFSHTETSLTYENSPFADMQMRREVKEMDWKKFVMTYNQNAEFHADDLLQKKLDREQKIRENDLKQKELEGYGGLPGPVDPSLVPKYDLGKLTEETAKSNEKLTTSDNTFISQMGKDKNWFDQQRIAWEKSPNGVDPLVSKYFNETESFRRKVEGDQKVILDANNSAIAKYGKMEDLIPKGSPSIDYYSKTTGEKYRYSPKDFVEFNNIVGKYVKTSVSGGTGGAGVSTSYNDAAAKSELSEKMYNLYKIYKADPKLMGAGGKSLMDNLKYYAKTVNIPYSKKLSLIMDETSRIVNERLTTSQGVTYGIPIATPAQKTSIANVLTQFADLADQTGGGLPNSPKFKSETARKLALEDGTQYSFTIVEGTERQPKAYMMTVSGKSGVVSMRVTPEQKTAVFGQQFEASPVVQALRPYQEQMNKTGGYSTAPIPDAPTTPSNSWMSSIDFPNVSTYGVKGNLVKIGTSGVQNLYTLKLAIYDPISQSWNNDISFPRSGALTEEAAIPTMSGLNDALLYELLNEKPATAKDLQLLKTASKKSL